MSGKPILAFDCATVGASVALMADGRLATRQVAQGKQAGQLVSAIEAVMRELGVGYGELGAIVTTHGPGSFTGVRIGLAALHGFVLVHGTPIKLVSTLEALAWEVATLADAPAQFITAIKAGKGELCMQPFSRDGAVPTATNAMALVPETWDAWPAPDFGNHRPVADAHYLAAPDAAVLCRIADQLSDSPLEAALPIYVRPPDAKLPAAV